nr:MAG TPA: hypothetical protein [Caudoviricetes sp.]DAS58069.1 MAG TPA: hypothetical protein [Caudoviricetes sp.]DAT37331.1 MAG TPA: hypothetical protein [Caudoviricetes sp.]
MNGVRSSKNDETRAEDERSSTVVRQREPNRSSPKR